MSQGHRVRLARGEAEARAERLHTPLRHGLGLHDDEVRRLLGKLPFELETRPLDDAQKERLARSLEASGLTVTFSPVRVTHGACARHPRLAESETCKRCQGRACAACVELSTKRSCPRCAKSLDVVRLLRALRVGVLLLVLFAVALAAYRERRAIEGWDRPVIVRVHPFAVEQHPASLAYLRDLDPKVFDPVAAFLEAQASRYDVAQSPLFEIATGRALHEAPPAPPLQGSMLDAMVFSLKLRWWTWRFEWSDGIEPAHIRVFALYHPPSPGASLEHSFGLERGRVAIAHLFAAADLEPSNAVVLAHEILHTVGASDKYDAEGRPRFPHGYADPARAPVHPQVAAEIMAGAIPESEAASTRAESLEQCVVGPGTAEEIGWARKD